MSIDFDALLSGYADQAAPVGLADPAAVRVQGERRTRRQLVGVLAGLALVAAAGALGVSSWDRAADPDPVRPLPTPTTTTGTEVAGPTTYPIATGPERFSARAIAVRHGRFVVVGDSSDFDTAGPAVYWSDDGETWQAPAADGLPESVNVTDVVADDTGFLAVGVAAEEPAAWYSDDGTSWRAAAVETDPRGRFDALWGVTGTRLGYVAWGFDGGRAVLLRSEDGRSWSSAGDPKAFDLTGDEVICGVREDADGLVVTGFDDRGGGGPTLTWTSPDAQTWTPSRAAGRRLTQCGEAESVRHWQATWPDVGRVSIEPYGEGNDVRVSPHE